MSEILDAINVLGEATQDMTIAKESFESIRQDANLAIDEAGYKVDTYINGARKEYSRFNHYVPLSEKITISALGLNKEEIEAYSYSQNSDYTPENSDGYLCFADIPELNNGFSNITVPNGMSVYLHLLMNVSGSNTEAMYTHIHLLRENTGQSGYHLVSDITDAFLYNHDGEITYQVEGRNWGDKYKDRNELKLSNFNNYDYFAAGALRILNLGDNTCEIFGVGIEVRV